MDRSRGKDGLRQARAARWRLSQVALWSNFGPVSPAKLMFVADKYESAVHDPKDPDTKRSYQALIAETHRQFYAAELSGLKVEPSFGSLQPYRNHREMLDDIRVNNHLFVFLGGELPDDHPLAERSPVAIGSFQLTNNLVFRVTHDLFGHGYGGFDFDAEGEEMAWRSHAGMYSAEALPALTTETRGQAAWFFYGRHVRRPDDSIPRADDPDFVPTPAKPFAPQKAAILHRDCWLA